MTLPQPIPQAPELPRPNVIDALIGAARTLVAHAGLLLPLSIGLEALKVVTMLVFVGAFGDYYGANVAVALLAVVVVVTTALSTQLAFDVHRGTPPRSMHELIARTRPTFPRFLLASAILWVLIRFGPWGVPLVGFLLLGACVALFFAPPAVADGAPSIQSALRNSVRLVGAAPVAALLLFLFDMFAWELVDALADSTVGRHAPLALWLTVRGTYQVFALPIASMAIATFYLQLDAYTKRTGWTPDLVPMPPLPQFQPLPPLPRFPQGPGHGGPGGIPGIPG